MSLLRRWIALATVSTLLWVAGVGLFHNHATAKADDQCAICVAVRQTTAAAPTAPTLFVRPVVVGNVSLPALPGAQMPSSSLLTGRSPPSL